MYLVTASEMQQADRMTIESFGLPGRILMENAGRGAFLTLLKRFPNISNQRVGIFAGRGNNGGDGFVIARYLAQENIKVTVYLLADKEKVKGDAAANLQLLPHLDIPLIEIRDEASFSKHKSSLLHHHIWVDAILGTGLNSDVKGFFKNIIKFMNESNKPILAVDVPSGLNSDTGQPCGICVQATCTATFALPKIGHHVIPGSDFSGDLEVIDIGIPPYIVDQIKPRQKIISPKVLKQYFKPRPTDSHKGNTGHLMIVAGSPGKTGAAAMTAISAMRTGAGLVTLCIPESLNPSLEAQSLEAMTQPLPETADGLVSEKAAEFIIKLSKNKKCLAMGPGMGQGAEVEKILAKIIPESKIPLIIDADGINNLSQNTKLLKKSKVPIILTPHPGEMARLLGTSTAKVQKDRIQCARQFSEKYKVHIVLKGARTVIAHPNGDVFVNPTGNPGMASGGMGDVLTGIIAGLVTQNYSPMEASQMGVYLHGAAGDRLQSSKGMFGYLAGEIMDLIPDQIQEIWG